MAEPAVFCFDLGSPYAYLAAERIATVFEDAGAEQPVPAHTHTQHGAPTIPRQRATGPSAETVRLTEAERDAFAVLVRRLSEGD